MKISCRISCLDILKISTYPDEMSCSDILSFCFRISSQDIQSDKLVSLGSLFSWSIAPPPSVSGGSAGYLEGRVDVCRDSGASEQVGMMESQSADRHFQRVFTGFARGVAPPNVVL